MKTLVCKIGGSISDKLPDSFFSTLVNLKKSGLCSPIIVHGGGPGINNTLKLHGVQPEFVNGLRVTSKEVLKIAEAELCGTMNKKIVSKIIKAGGTGFGMSGVDGSLLTASPADPTGVLGFVGKVETVNSEWIRLIADNGAIPVIAPIGIDQNGQKYNINADTAAAAVANAFNANIALISNIPGIMEKTEKGMVVHKQLTEAEIAAMIRSGIINGGMIPKVQSALDALENGAEEAVILNGYEPGDLERYFNSGDAGTKIIHSKEVKKHA